MTVSLTRPPLVFLELFVFLKESNENDITNKDAMVNQTLP